MMPDAHFFISDARVQKAVNGTRGCAEKPMSDVIDGQKNQYVDLVMEGGGVLGIALVGYTYVLEQAGIRFLGIGGTSAGSINALMIAALGSPGEAKSERLVNVLANMPMEKFIDGDDDARDFSEAIAKKAGMMKLLFKATQVVDNLKEDLGLNPGKEFFDWLTTELKKVSVHTTAQLNHKLSQVPDSLQIRAGARDEKPLSEIERVGRLAMVAADITTETKVEFPKMAHLYWCNPDEVSPACYARASMSIPFFFHPYRVHGCPPNLDGFRKAGYHGTLPEEVLFMDGGIMSNFPINLFHEPYTVPISPTFGVKIGVDGKQPAVISKPSQLLSAIFDAARHTLDQDFIAQNPDYRHLVATIDTGSHSWLNFAMNDDEKRDLFARGAEKAAEFLCEFDWPGYKEIRAELAHAFRASNAVKPVQK